MFENTPSDRIQVVGRGDLLHPGACMLCGSGNSEEGYVDLGVYYDYEGQMYLCITCTRQVSEVIGCLLPEEAKIQRELMSTVQSENEQLKTELEAARERLDAFDRAFVNVKFPSDLGDSDSGPLGDEDGKGSGSLNTELAEPVLTGADSGESTSEESITLSRRSDSSTSKLRDGSSRRNRLEL